MKGGLDIVTGGTDTHLMLVDLRPKGVKGNATEAALGRAHITCNKNGIPFDTEKPTVTSGVRLGTPAGTTRGFGEPEFRQIARLDRRGGRRAGRERRGGQCRGRGKGARRGPGPLRPVPDLPRPLIPTRPLALGAHPSGNRARERCQWPTTRSTTGRCPSGALRALRARPCGRGVERGVDRPPSGAQARAGVRSAGPLHGAAAAARPCGRHLGAQTAAILSHLGRGTPSTRATRRRTPTDALIGNANDVLDEITLNGGRQMWTRETWADFTSERLPRWMRIFEETGRRHGLEPGRGHMFATPEPGLADLATAALWFTMTRHRRELSPLLERHAPSVASLSRRIADQPAIAAMRADWATRHGTAYCGGQIEASIRSMLGEG